MAGGAEGTATPRPMSEWGRVCMCVRTDRCVGALKNAQCFLYLSIRLHGWAGGRERIAINRSGEVGKRS